MKEQIFEEQVLMREEKGWIPHVGHMIEGRHHLRKDTPHPPHPHTHTQTTDKPMKNKHVTMNLKLFLMAN